jgi:hemerythrin
MIKWSESFSVSHVGIVFDKNKLEEFFNEMLAYLVIWLSKHIMQTDKKLGLFLL